MKLYRWNPALVLLAFAVTAMGPALAREIRVDGPQALTASLKTAEAGDVIILKDGGWRDAKISVNHGGEAGKPLEIRAETPGGVSLSGASFLAINAPYVTVGGLLFHGGAIARDAVIQLNSHHGIVRETAIVDYNPTAFDTRYYWVFFNGDDNLIDRCYFKGKSNLEPLIGNALEKSRRNAVTNSCFKNIPYVANANGREIIRVWGSGKVEERDEDGAYFTIEGNLFDHADGEGVETISLKSNHNIVRHNTVVATRGGINIRRGNFNVVQDNVVLGQRSEGAAGLRMSGRDNLVQGNYIAGCSYGMRVACGEFITDALTPAYVPDLKPNGRKSAPIRIPTYPQVLRLKLIDNVVVESTGPDLELGSAYKNHWPTSQQVLLPADCVIANNRFIRPQGGTSVLVTVPDTAPPLDRFSFEPNRVFKNVLIAPKNVPTVVADGFAREEIATDWTEARERSGRKPLGLNDVGPAWVIALRKTGNFSMEDPLPSDAANETAPRIKKKPAK